MKCVYKCVCVCAHACRVLTGPSLSSSRAQSCHLHLSYTERALESHTHSHTRRALHRCTHSLRQAEAHTGAATPQAATHRGESEHGPSSSLLPSLSLSLCSSSGSYCLSEPSLCFSFPLSTEHPTILLLQYDMKQSNTWTHH